MELKVKRLTETARLPEYATDGSACMDLFVDGAEQTVSIRSCGPSVSTFRTGLAFEVPPGYAMLIFSRSGHGFRYGVRLSNCVGVIDSDYRGEVMVALQSDSPVPFLVRPGDRIAQAMLVAIPQVVPLEVVELSETGRGDGGFGSTGA